MRIETRSYESSHGRKPRGLGLWQFAIERREGEFTTFQAHGTYSEALKAARAEARQIGGASAIHVQA